MAIVDPNNKDIDRKPRFHVRAGKKLFKVVSSTRQMMDSGSQAVRVRCVVVKDLMPDSKTEDPANDVGLSCDARLWNTERGALGMARFARGLKYMQAFDTDDDGLWLESILSSNDGVFLGEVKVDAVTGNDGKVKHYAEIDKFAPYDGPKEPAWQELVDRSYEEAVKAAEEREKRKSRSGGGGGGRRSSGGGGGGSDTSEYGF